MQRILFSFLFFFLILLHVSGQTQPEKAKTIAGGVISAMGGSENFASVKYISWTFFGYRRIIWDKMNSRVRVDYLNKKLSIITDLNDDTTKLYMNDVEITQPDSLKKYGFKGKKIWANDSYWLLMPFKLLDNGVNLDFVKDTVLNNSETSVIQLTFNQVGFTPENKYWVYVDNKTNYVIQWDYYREYSDTVPEFSNSWGGYKKYENIFLSGDRGTEGEITDICVWNYLPESVFRGASIPELKCKE